MDNRDEVIPQIILGTATHFPEGYKDAMFTLWYSRGKLGLAEFQRIMPPCLDVFNQKPERETVRRWMADWKERAVALDEEVFAQVNGKMVAEKVEMLNRHAGVGVQMQDMAMKYLKTHEDDLGVSTSVRLLVAGVEIERESRGVATSIEKINNMSDTDLEKEIQRLISRSPVELLPSEVDDDLDASDEH